tara:strand:+ start:214 stop:330 length:117 start_codon:yes stop_codon:yes gene_type:complete
VVEEVALILGLHLIVVETLADQVVVIVVVVTAHNLVVT